MKHLAIAYEGILIILGVLSLVLLGAGKRKKYYFPSFLRFYMIFTVIIFLSVIRSYFLLNIPKTASFWIYISHGVTTSLSFLLVYFGVITVHRILNLPKSRREDLILAVLAGSAALMISPLSIEYRDGFIIHRGSSYLATLVYLFFLAYMLVRLTVEFRKIKLKEDRIFVIFLGVLTLFGLTESAVSFAENIRAPFAKMDLSEDSVIISTIPYLGFSIYIIYLLVKKINTKQSLPGREELLKIGFSPRESDVLNLIVLGYSNRKISDELCISMATVKTHINNIFRKAEVSNRFELAKKLERS